MASIDLDILTKRIREKMSALELNQAQLAKKAGITPAALSQILSKDRQPSGNVLIKIARALDVTVDYLVGNSDSTDIENLMHNSEFLTFYSTFSELTNNDKQQVTSLMEFLKSKKKEKG